MKTYLRFLMILWIILCILGIIFFSKSIVKNICPNGEDDWTRPGCGHSAVEINKKNCEGVGGTFMYGGIHGAGSCIITPPQ